MPHPWLAPVPAQSCPVCTGSSVNGKILFLALHQGQPHNGDRTVPNQATGGADWGVGESLALPVVSVVVHCVQAQFWHLQPCLPGVSRWETSRVLLCFHLSSAFQTLLVYPAQGLEGLERLFQPLRAGRRVHGSGKEHRQATPFLMVPSQPERLPCVTKPGCCPWSRVALPCSPLVAFGDNDGTALG